MIAIPYDKVKQAIQSQAGLSSQEVDKRVDDKLASLAGLISRDGAIHILANELSVKVMPERDKLKVKDLLPGMRGITIPLRVMRKYEVREFSREGRSGKVGSFLAGDETGVVRVTLWNEQADKLLHIEDGITVQLKDATVKDNQGRVEVHLQTGSDIIISPKGIVVEATGTPQERSYASKKIGELSQGDEFVDILGTIVQVFDPRSFTRKDGKTGTVMNLIIDDGSGTIRVSLWDQDVNTMIGDAANKPELLAESKLELLGQILKVQGRCKLNAAYNTLELSAQHFEKNPDPAAEIARLG